MSERGSGLVSVVMPVYNAAATVALAAGDILDQTHVDLELVAVDDGSTDDSVEILEGIGDERVRVVRHERNRGLTAALNTGIAAARGDLIARMDADDRTDPSRLAKQVALMATRPRLGVVGTAADMVTLPSGEHEPFAGPADNLPLQRAMLSLNWIVHGSVLVRREALQSVGGYRDTEPAEDYDIWLRIAEHYEIAIIDEPLYTYVKHEASVSSRNLDRQKIAAERMLTNAIARRSGRADDLGAVLDVAHARQVLGARRLAVHHLAWAGRLANRGRYGDALAVAAHVATVLGRR